jgi:TM2 domain-containing membrane protein YozV
MLLRVIIVFLFFFNTAGLCSQTKIQRFAKRVALNALFEKDAEGFLELAPTVQSDQNIRLTAIALNLTLGVFGMHRLYLGTDVKVPVFYTLTIGGGMVLWIVDLGYLIFEDDISRFYNNPGMFMWNAAKKTEDEN